MRSDLAVAIPLGLRRLRARPLQALGIAAAFAAAVALPAIGSATGAFAHEDSVRLRLAERGPAARAFVVDSRLLPGGEVPELVDQVVAGFSRVSEPVRRIRVYNPVAPSDERGVRLVVVEGEAARADVVVETGRMPVAAGEGLGLTRAHEVGDVVDLGDGLSLEVTGRGFVASGSLPDPSALGERALLVPGVNGPLAGVVAEQRSGVITSAVLAPARVRAYEVPALAEAMRRGVVRIERLATIDQPSAPLPLLDELAERGKTARGRLVLIAAQAAALILAFAAFAAAMRHRDTKLLEEQLATFGGGGLAPTVARAVEAGIPAVAGAIAALVAVVIGTRAVSASRELPGEFVVTALAPGILLLVLGCALLGTAIIVLAGRQEGVQARGLGWLDAAALAALAVIVWQAVETGALSPERVGEGAGAPVLLLIPVLTFFASAVILMRLLPAIFRLGEQAARRAALPLRLALLSAARRPSQAAAATTFLAVALGTAIFSLNYRATLSEQAGDEARFRAGAEWRVVERGEEPRSADVSPLTRYASITQEAPKPVLRLAASVHEAEVAGGSRSLTLLGLPPQAFGGLGGWRDNFSDVSLGELARRVRPEPMKLEGISIPEDAQALRLWARGETVRLRMIALHFLLTGQEFARVDLQPLTREWERQDAEIPPAVRGAQLIGIEFPALDSGDETDSGHVDFGGLRVLRGGGWEALPPLRDWVASPAPFGPGASTDLRSFADAPIPQGTRFSINGSPLARLRPQVPLTLPAVVGRDLLPAVVDGALTVDVPAAGLSVPLDIVGSAELVPTVVTSPEAFALVDYDALFAVLNVDRPDAAPPSEAWFLQPQPPGVAAALAEPPFRTEQAVSAERLEERLRDDPLAAGASRVLGLGALAAMLIGVIALALATRTAVRDERALNAEYEALGVPPRSLARSVQLRLLLLAGIGVVAGALGGFLAVQLIAALVAVTGIGTAPLPPIQALIEWPASASIVLLVGVTALVAAAWIAGRDLRRTAGGRLRG